MRCQSGTVPAGTQPLRAGLGGARASSAVSWMEGDCSLALVEDMARCTRVATHIAVPLYIIHPHPEIVEERRGLAHGEVSDVRRSMAQSTPQ